MNDEKLNTIGMMVVDGNGRIGMVIRANQHTCRVKYGADGPFLILLKRGLRVATNQEVIAAGLDGVGRADPLRKDLSQIVKR